MNECFYYDLISGVLLTPSAKLNLMGLKPASLIGGSSPFQ